MLNKTRAGINGLSIPQFLETSPPFIINSFKTLVIKHLGFPDIQDCPENRINGIQGREGRGSDVLRMVPLGMASVDR